MAATAWSLASGGRRVNLAYSLGALCLILLAAIVTAESFNSNANTNANSNAQHQEQLALSTSGAEIAPAGPEARSQQQLAGAQHDDLLASGSNNNNNYLQQQQQPDNGANQLHQSHQQQQQAPGQKAKKIQIVYIKVPLAKLRPSLATSEGAYAAQASNSSVKVAEPYDSSK